MTKIRSTRAHSLKHTAWALVLSSAFTASQAQDARSDPGGSFDLLISGTGVSFGNGQDMTGIRFAWRDGAFVRVNGLNVSFWTPVEEPAGEVNGVAIGVLCPAAARLRGISLGLGGVLAGSSVSGLTVGGLGVVSQGDMLGMNIAGLGLVSQGRMSGMNVGGLGIVAQGGLAGVNLAALGVVSQNDLSGITLAGLGAVSQGALFGVAVGGLGLVSQGAVVGCSVGGLGFVAQGSIVGVGIAGLGMVSQKGIAGLSVAGLGVVAQEDIHGVTVTVGMVKSEWSLTGISVGCYRLKAPEIAGVNLSVLWTESNALTGLTVGAYNRTYGTQRGLVIGIFNHAEDLLGIQIGLLNYVEGNPTWARILPFVNANF